jgi:dipeptidyl aminopeptidase/acylaminoacyl peptidase
MKRARRPVCREFRQLFCALATLISCAVSWLILNAAESATTTTDIATLNSPGRHEVLLQGDGLILGGILFRPATTDGRAPGIIVLHGWAEKGVPGAPRVERVAHRLSEQGYVTLALSMRGWPPSEGDDDCGLKQPNDVAKAADWLLSLPGVAADHVGVIGFSHGGMVALLAASRSSRIKAVAAFYPVTDIPRWRETVNHSGIRDYYVPRICEFGKSRSPIDVASSIKARVLLIHGDRDTRVPPEQSVRMQEAMSKANRQVELVLVPGAEHAFNAATREQTWEPVLELFSTQLRTK